MPAPAHTPSSRLKTPQPPIQYTAPELIYGASAGAAPESQRQPSAADVFSLGVLSHDLLTGRPLLPASCSLAEYKARVGALSGVDVSGLPPQLQVRPRGRAAGGWARGVRGHKGWAVR